MVNIYVNISQFEEIHEFFKCYLLCMIIFVSWNITDITTQAQTLFCASSVILYHHYNSTVNLILLCFRFEKKVLIERSVVFPFAFLLNNRLDMLCIVSTQYKLIKLTQKNKILTQKHVCHGFNEKCSLIGSCIYTQGSQLVVLHVEVIELLGWF